MYVRYFLVYRLWRRVNNNPSVRCKISASAVESLGPRQPPQVAAYLRDNVLPIVPKSMENSNGSSTATKFLVSAKFDVEKSCGQFLRFTRSLDDPLTSAAKSDRVEVIQKKKKNSVCPRCIYLIIFFIYIVTRSLLLPKVLYIVVSKYHQKKLCKNKKLDVYFTLCNLSLYFAPLLMLIYVQWQYLASLKISSLSLEYTSSYIFSLFSLVSGKYSWENMHGGRF